MDKQVNKQVSSVKICFDPDMINGIVNRIDADPTIAPKGVAQIEFYFYLLQILRSGQPMDITVEPEAPASKEESVVWSNDDTSNGTD